MATPANDVWFWRRPRFWLWLSIGVMLGLLLASLRDVLDMIDPNSELMSGSTSASNAPAVQDSGPQSKFVESQNVQMPTKEELLEDKGLQSKPSDLHDVKMPSKLQIQQPQQSKPPEVFSSPAKKDDIHAAQEQKEGRLAANATLVPPSKVKGSKLTVMDPAMRSAPDPKHHQTGGSVWPPGAASSYEWSKAVMKMYAVPPRKSKLKETIFAMDPERREACGENCVAHCLAGQPRDMVLVKGLWKAVKHLLFDAFSKERHIFAALSVSEIISSAPGEGEEGFLRGGHIGAVAPHMLLRQLKYMDIDRTVLLDEGCQFGSCLKKGAGIVCSSRPLGLTNLFDKKRGIVANICDVQVRRFQTCMNLIREFEQDMSMAFSWVTRQRPDVYWKNPFKYFSKQHDPSIVYLHPWAACGYGGADWFYFTGRKNADVIARLPDEFSCHMYLQEGVLPSPCVACLGCECTMVAWLRKNRIQFKPQHAQLAVAKFCGEGCPPDYKPKAPYNIMANTSGYGANGERKTKKASASVGNLSA